jgi:hypothetical protein
VAVVDSAARVVRAAYTLAELLGGESDALAWIATASGDGATALPQHLTLDNKAIILEELADAGALAGTDVDKVRLREIGEVLRLAPLLRAAEDARRPAPTSRLVCTVPPELVLPARMRHIQRSLSMLVADSLRTPGDHVLLAAPYWSKPGTDQLRGALDRACEHNVPITLLGARRKDAAHHASMMAFARELWGATPNVEVFTFVPPRDNSLFHAKIVAGRRGYLGTGNLSIGGFEGNVEVGLPLDETDVERVWWLIDQLVEAELLQKEELVA